MNRTTIPYIECIIYGLTYYIFNFEPVYLSKVDWNAVKFAYTTSETVADQIKSMISDNPDNIPSVEHLIELGCDGTSASSFKDFIDSQIYCYGRLKEQYGDEFEARLKRMAKQ